MHYVEDQIEVPDEISIAGYDDVSYSKVSPIPITTIHQDIQEMSLKVVNMIMAQIENGDTVIEKIWIAPELIVRNSTRPR